VDTNVLSELRKGERGSAEVRLWYDAAADEDLYTSVLVLGEIRKGVEMVRDRDPMQAAALEAWLLHIETQFSGRILVVDGKVSEQWGRLSARRPAPAVDTLLAATARVHGLTLVTRNVADFEETGVPVRNPFDRPSSAAGKR